MGGRGQAKVLRVITLYRGGVDGGAVLQYYNGGRKVVSNVFLFLGLKKRMRQILLDVFIQLGIHMVDTVPGVVVVFRESSGAGAPAPLGLLALPSWGGGPGIATWDSCSSWMSGPWSASWP